MNKSVENYFIEGCLRCPLGATPDCKVHKWMPELKLLRKIVLETGITEESKWGVPCYTYQNSNVLSVSAFKSFCAISFFKGSLLNDTHQLLEKPGPNSQATRLIKFVDVETVKNHEEHIKSYIYVAIEVEKAGLKVQFKKNPEPMPAELEQILDDDPVLKNAFQSLTPGRQRGYILYFSAPKKSETRITRIEKCTGKIINGEGLHDKYNRSKK